MRRQLFLYSQVDGFKILQFYRFAHKLFQAIRIGGTYCFTPVVSRTVEMWKSGKETALNEGKKSGREEGGEKA